MLNESNVKNLELSTKPESHENPSTTNPIENHPLSPSEPTSILEFLVAKGYITITEDEIKDRSHADVIMKSIAVIQTIWFILQVIARAVEGLAITELEIVTVGFAILNFGTYFLWWNKPLRVRHPVRVYWRQRERKIKGEEGQGQEAQGEGWLSWLGMAATNVVGYIYFNHNPKGIMLWIFALTFLLPFIPCHIVFVCLEILRDEDDSDLVSPISSRLTNDPFYLYIAVYGIATLFGAIHCIPWVFPFPTHTEQMLWRISAVAVAVSPIAMGLLHGCIKKQDHLPWWFCIIVVFLLFILPLAYAVFRTTLIVIAFTSLRDLPSNAYQTVHWSTLLPHIG
ncbi:hypothetical protein VNI00_016962 [Paramarasmius palmivorus]|uniref:Uncharacterized protein n=1 Tax=Paramarasmius palmivorus TaxID=297713 RepID=A0AAW0BAW9_9AGAR